MASRFKYACFISYSHGEEELVRGFIAQFKAALKASLEPLVDIPVFIDEERLKAGFKYNEALAEALCHSVCMVVVYCPVYERRSYCGREFEAMVRLEKRRLGLLTHGDTHRGLIIPVVLRGFKQLPNRIQGERQAIDFSHFNLAAEQMSRNPDFVQKFEEIAQQIYDHFLALEQVEDVVCQECKGFQLPRQEEVAPWRLTVGGGDGWPPPFPNR